MQLEPSGGEKVDLLYGFEGPTPKQELARDALEKFILYGGAVGGGKTWWLCAESLRMSLAFEGNRGFMCRHEATAFRNTTLATLLKLIDQVEELTKQKILSNHLETKKRITLVNGSVILYGALGEESDVERIKSLEIGWFAVDEASETKQGNVQMLKSRLRWKLPSGQYPPFKGIFASNPEPGWVKNVFVTPQQMGEPLPNHRFIQALPTDNPFLPPTYVGDLRAENPEAWVQKYLDGSWDALEGQIWSEFNYDTHVIEPFHVPSQWPRFRALDHGQSNPTACLWFAIDPDENLYVYQEYYSPGIVSKHCGEINALSADEEYDYTILPHDAFNKTREKDEQLWSVADEYHENGIHGIRCQNDVKAGINRVGEYLKVHQGRGNSILGREGNCPHLFIFNTCKNLILEIPDYIWDKDKEKPVKTNDHACDALRYGIMSRPSVTKVEEKIPHNSFLEMRRRMIESEKLARRRSSSQVLEYTRRYYN